MENDDQLNTYSWSSPPGLREKMDEVGQAIRGAGASSFERTTSSSSITSMTTAKRRKLNDKNLNNIDEITVLNDIATKSTSKATRPIAETGNLSSVDNVHQDQAKNSNNNAAPTSSSIASNIELNAPTSKIDIELLLKENTSLREKNLALQDELLYLRETSVGKL